MGASPTLERIVTIEERLDALEMAFMAVMAGDQGTADEEGRDSLGSHGGSVLAYDDYHLTQAEKAGHLNPRLRRVMDRAHWLLQGKPNEPVGGPTTDNDGDA
jgi:hypothetical protein